MAILPDWNLSVLTIPAYYLLSTVLHFYAISVAAQGQLTKWDNRNPRSSDLKAELKARLPAETFATYERAEACHANSMENLPLFATAIILGIMAGLDSKDMDGFVLYFLAVRVAYTAVYLLHTTQALTVLRSSLWMDGVGLCFGPLIKAAKPLGEEPFSF